MGATRAGEDKLGFKIGFNGYREVVGGKRVGRRSTALVRH